MTGAEQHQIAGDPPPREQHSSKKLEVQRQLDEAKRRYLEAKVQIDNLRNDLAAEICVLRAGDVITVVDRRKEFQGKVQFIGSAISKLEREAPVIGAQTGRVATGIRMKQSTGTFGKWSFRIRSFETTFSEGKWIVTRRPATGF